MDHHYVPIFYLRYWTDGPDKKVPYFSRHKGKIVEGRIAPRSTGYEPRLYALDKVSAEREDLLERTFFHPLDSAAAPIHRRLETKAPPFTFSFDDRATWAKFLLAATARVPDQVKRAKELGTSILLKVLEEDPEEFLRVKGSQPEATLTEWVMKHQLGLLENVGLANLLNWLSRLENLRPVMDLEWTVHQLTNPRFSFLTCDRPFLSSCSPDDPRFTIVFPLSPRSLFAAAKTKTFADSLYMATDRRLAQRTNISIVQNATLRVYGRADLAFIEKHLNGPSSPPPWAQDQEDCPSA